MKNRLYKISAALVLAVVLPIFVSNAQIVEPVEQKTPEGFVDPQINIKNIGSNYEGTLLAADTGLYQVRDGILWPLWTEGSVSRIVRGNSWFFITSKGILKSDDLITFREINEGLPVLTIKKYADGEKSFEKQVAALKDIHVHPQNPDILVTATRDGIFLSRNGGETWEDLGFSSKTNGTKAVAVANMKNADGTEELTVFHSQPIYGLSYIQPDKKNAKWIDITAGFEKVPTMSNPDEIADILTVYTEDENGMGTTEVYLSQTYLPYLYKLDWNGKKAVQIGKYESDGLDTLDSLFMDGAMIYGVRKNGFMSFDTRRGIFNLKPAVAEDWKKLSSLTGKRAQCLYIPSEVAGSVNPVIMNELWLLDMDTVDNAYADIADDRRGLYVPAGQNNPGAQLQGFIDIAKENDLDTIIVDMKDDYGLLRYKTDNPAILEKATISSYAIDIDKFVRQCKENGIYLVARIVAFKDKNLCKYQKGKYAIVDSVTGAQWTGIKYYEDVLDEEGNVTGTTPVYYDEIWTDPYCEEVWEYNVNIAKDLVEKGFDEIQFDYIRFPTDGLNIERTKYRWQDEGMDKESALISFLSYARENLDVPIGIDIYGANGWHRSGARTGQDVEMLAPYVDVICPMFYPSHWEQYFLAQAPAAERTYRIYNQGTYRNTVMARNKVIVRPWVQAFYLAVSYDKTWYGKDYVQRQVYGVRDSVDRGYMYWNNSGKYDMISPDPGDTEYPWKY